MVVGMNGMVMTVRGPVAASELGFCHGHEHLFNCNEFAASLNHDLLIDDFGKTMEELALFRQCGGGCIVDAQPVGCGRMPEWLSSASWLSGVHIVASTGFHKLDYYPPGHWAHTLPEDTVRRIFESEIAEGMYEHADAYPPAGRVNAKAGVIKAAAPPGGVSGRYAALLGAAAECSRRTGAPVLCHTDANRCAQDVLGFFAGRGVKPRSVIFCHLDRSLDDTGPIFDAAKAGAFIELDTIGRFKYHGDEAEARLILGLVESGLEDSVLLGLDTTRARMKSYGGGIGLDYIAAEFLPRLSREGVPEPVLHKFMRENPARAFSIQKD